MPDEPEPLTPAGNQLRTLDPEAIKAVAQRDYEEMRQLARKPGASVVGTGAEIDAELERRTQAHTAGMSLTERALFLQIYNGEYNRLVSARLQQGTGCVVVIGIAFLMVVIGSLLGIR